MRSSIDLERGMLCLNADRRQRPGLAVGARITLPDIDGATVEFPAVFAEALSTVIFLPRPLATVVPGPGDGLGLRVERYLEGKVQILGVSVEPAKEGKKFLERVTRDCEEDRLHIPLDPCPVRLLCDPDAKLIRAVGTENEGHSAGLIVKWAYVSDSAADRPSPVALAKAAVAIASGESPPAATNHTCYNFGTYFFFFTRHRGIQRSRF